MSQSDAVKRRRAARKHTFYCYAGNMRAYLRCPKQCHECKRQERNGTHGGKYEPV